MRLSDHDYNKLRILRHMRRTGPVSRVELAEPTGLTKGTISELTADLLHRGLIAEGSLSVRSRGRPRIQLRINPDAAYAISFLQMLDGTASIDIVNLQGERIFSRRREFSTPDDIDALVPRVATLIEETIEHGPVKRKDIRHVGIILPGHLDRRNGAIHWLPPLAPDHMPLPAGPQLQRLLGIPVTLDNRAAVVARAEHWFGRGDRPDNFSLVALLEFGMGAARYVDGILQTGFNGMNSEFSHVKVAFESGRPCFCGGSGCLATYCTIPAIVRGLAVLRGASEAPLSKMTKVFREVVDDARSGDTAAVAVFDLAGRALGTSVASHINEHDPGHVVVTASEEGLLEMIAPSFRAVLASQVLPSLREQTSIDLRELPVEAFGQGAAGLVLEQMYRSK